MAVVNEEWKQVWPGGLAIRTYIENNPDAVKCRHVMDVGTGSGIIAFAALKAGASRVDAYDINPNATAALEPHPNLNIHTASPMFKPTDAEVICLGSIFINAKALKWLIELRYQGKEILIGDRDFVIPQHMTKIGDEIWTVKYPAHSLLAP